jgi:hypothetical protein
MWRSEVGRELETVAMWPNLAVLPLRRPPGWKVPETAVVPALVWKLKRKTASPILGPAREILMGKVLVVPAAAAPRQLAIQEWRRNVLLRLWTLVWLGLGQKATIFLLQMGGRRTVWEITGGRLIPPITWQKWVMQRPKVAVVMKNIAGRGARHSYHGGFRLAASDHSPKLLALTVNPWDLLKLDRTWLKTVQHSALQQQDMLCGVMQVLILE